MTESAIQSKIMKRLRAEGWFVIKIIVANMSGLPDLLALKPTAVLFVEVKRPGKKPSAIQEHMHAKLRALGFRVEVLDQ